MLKQINNVMEKSGIFWSTWRTKRDSLYGMGKTIEDGFYLMNHESGRAGCLYHFFDEEDLRDIYKKAGFNIISIDEKTYTENNKEKTASWYVVVATKKDKDE